MPTEPVHAALFAWEQVSKATSSLGEKEKVKEKRMKRKEKMK